MSHYMLPPSPKEEKANSIAGFKTDTDISKTSNRRERELQAWQPSEDASAASPPGGASGPAPNGGARDDLTFGAGASNGGAWNQFEVNERLFGVKANFDEDLYTTKLDRTAPDYKERERWAAGIANEILQSQTGNAHVAEERKQDFVGEGKDEEEKCVCNIVSLLGYRSDVGLSIGTVLWYAARMHTCRQGLASPVKQALFRLRAASRISRGYRSTRQTGQLCLVTRTRIRRTLGRARLRLGRTR